MGFFLFLDGGSTGFLFFDAGSADFFFDASSAATLYGISGLPVPNTSIADEICALCTRIKWYIFLLFRRSPEAPVTTLKFPLRWNVKLKREKSKEQKKKTT